jgi:hypothetical protein
MLVLSMIHRKNYGSIYTLIVAMNIQVGVMTEKNTLTKIQLRRKKQLIDVVIGIKIIRYIY